ncbi:glycosyltransferase [Labilibaculum sp.]|uniref:glycosyltransferase family 2 protein n=1 Tax=Labilibaculum sp. TaxID=2060723 RepID=UPI002AA88265|nr:glycosyltransferase [Labilibaculum sp.]
MKIAAITITYNDNYKFDEWCQYYQDYKDDLYKHIIVDNGSTEEYLKKVKDYFKDSIIIERESNGGCTGAYNDGLHFALQDSIVESIMLIGNDIKWAKGAIKALYNYLYSNTNLGMVAPVMLKRNSKIIESYGVNVSSIGIPKIQNRNQSLSEVPVSKIVSYVQGGANMAKREFYEKVGLQDAKLFMYNDEIDMYFRMKKCGFIEGVTKESIAWHQHINYPSSQDMSADMAYLNGRNRVYIIKQHMGAKGVFLFSYMLFFETAVFIRDIFSKRSRKIYFHKWKGFWAGMINNMDNSFLNDNE